MKLECGCDHIKLTGTVFRNFVLIVKSIKFRRNRLVECCIIKACLTSAVRH